MPWSIYCFFNENLVLTNFMFSMFSFMYMSILSKLLIMHVHPLSHVPSCIYICGLVMFWIYMYTLVCTWHTYALKKSSFYDFHVLRNLELECLFSWLYVFTYTLYTHLLIVFSWLCFHEHDMGFMDFEYLVTMWFTCVSWNIILFYSLLEGFRTSFQVFSI